MDDQKLEELKIQLQQLRGEARVFVQQIPPAQLYGAIGVVICTIFFFLIIRLFKRRSSNTVVLTGLNGSGKIVLFYQLRDGSSHQGTVTSMEPNEETFVLHSEAAKAQVGVSASPIDIARAYMAGRTSEEGQDLHNFISNGETAQPNNEFVRIIVGVYILVSKLHIVTIFYYSFTTYR